MSKSMNEVLGPVLWLQIQNDIVKLSEQGLSATDVLENIRHKYFETFQALSVSFSRQTVSRVLARYHENKGTIAEQIKPDIITYLKPPDTIDTENELKLCVASAAAIRDWSLECASVAGTDQLKAGWAKLSLDASKTLSDIVIKAQEQIAAKIEAGEDTTLEEQRLAELQALALEKRKAKD